MRKYILYSPHFVVQNWAVLRLRCSTISALNYGNLKLLLSHKRRVDGFLRLPAPPPSGRALPACAPAPSTTLQAHRGNIQGTFKDIFRTCREYSRNIQGTFRGKSRAPPLLCASSSLYYLKADISGMLHYSVGSRNILLLLVVQGKRAVGSAQHSTRHVPWFDLLWHWCSMALFHEGFPTESFSIPSAIP